MNTIKKPCINNTNVQTNTSNIPVCNIIQRSAPNFGGRRGSDAEAAASQPTNAQEDNENQGIGVYVYVCACRLLDCMN
jgi:hypothetical protein